jgi:tripartite-type tricarboxylate transporter receptor subunit TctC
VARIDIVHIPYKGSAQATAEVAAGHVQMSFSQPTVALPHEGVAEQDAWRDRPEAAAVMARCAASCRCGTPGVRGIVVAARARAREDSEAIIERLHKEIVAGLRSPEIERRLLTDGSEVGGGSPETFGPYIRSEIAKWTRVVKEAGIKVE